MAGPLSGGPLLSFSLTSLKFGKVTAGKTSGSKTVKITNIGNFSLAIDNITVTGDFARKAGPAKTDCGAPLAAGASCTVRVTFTPTLTGARIGELTFTDNASGSPQSLALSGTGG